MQACPNCQFENDDQVLHCSSCGSDLTWVGTIADDPAPSNQIADELATRAVSGARTSADHTTSHMPMGAVFAARYRIRRRLGAGGMGAVYLAFDQAT